MVTIAIVGVGFSGTLTAVHLLQRGLGGDGRVILLNRSGPMARGVAYGTQSQRHVLNVPAGSMSALENDPESFVRFVRQRDTTAGRGTFVSRHFYGAYLEWLLDAAASQATDVTLERVTAEALAIEPAPDGTQATVWLSSGARIRADRVVLAVGNYPPQSPLLDDDLFFSSDRRYVPDPWRPGALAMADPRAPVFLIGSGLTMLDIALELRALGMEGGLIAVSRHGLLPLPHLVRPQTVDGLDDGLPRVLVEGPRTVRAYIRAIRRHVDEAAARGVDWRDIMAVLRPWTAGLWQALSLDERRRFLRHVRPFWDVHRHRVAPQTHEAFACLQRAGHVTILAARILGVRGAHHRVIVRLRPRGSREARELEVGTVVNCTGPASDTRRLRDPLFDNLRARGLIRPDALGLGIETSPAGALIGADGCASSILYYVGPFSRARDWEATAVPELRRYSRQLAHHLIETLSRRRASTTDAGTAIESRARQMYARPAGIRLHLNENTKGCSPQVLEALASLRVHDVSSYPDSARAVVRCARHLGVDATNVALTNGLDEGIRAIAVTHLRPSPDCWVPEAIVPQPAFEIFARVAALVGGHTVPVLPRDDFVIASEDVLAAVTPRTRVVFLTSPNNPTGVSMPLERIEAIATQVPPHIVLFVDEAYADFSAATFIPRLGSWPNVIVGRSFSKAYGLAGLRLGALVASTAALARIRPAIGLFSVNVAVLAAFEAALEDTDHLGDYLRQVNDSKALVYAACDRLGLKYWKSDANFVLVHTGRDTRRVVDAAQQRGVSLCDLSGAPLCVGCVRITVGLIEHTRCAIAILMDLLGAPSRPGVLAESSPAHA